MSKKRLAEVIELRRADILGYTERCFADLFDELLQIDSDTVLEIAKNNNKIKKIFSANVLDHVSKFVKVDRDRIAVLDDNPIGIGMPPFTVILDSLVGIDYQKDEDIILTCFIASMAKDQVNTIWALKEERNVSLTMLAA